jgi:hypothetical protein
VVGSLPVAVDVEAGSVVRPGSLVPGVSLPVPLVGSLAEGVDCVADPAPPVPLPEQPDTAIANASDARAMTVRFMTTA